MQNNTEFQCNICHRNYKSRGWLDNHNRRFHPQNNNDIPPLNIELSSDSEQELNIELNQDDDKNQDWDKDQLDLALELSMKEQYKDFIPEEDDVLEMSSNKACAICLSKKANVAFINCGHMVSCEECANKLKRGKCPICRKKILKILKIYT